MGLRSQLLLVSLCLLLLPWGGCQYVQEMENLLRDNHSRAMINQTALLARMINQNVSLPAAAGGSPFYTPMRYQPVELDGYDDDWGSHASEVLVSKTTPLQVRIQKALQGRDLYLFLQIRDGERQYHHPGQSYQRSDHVRLITQTLDPANGEHSIEWLLFTSGPGQLQVVKHVDGDKKLYTAPAIEAWWVEVSGGYNLEVRIPQSRLMDSFDLQIYDRDPSEKRAHLALSTRKGGAPSRWVKPLTHLSPLLQPWRTQDTDITLVDPAGWPLAPQKNWLLETETEPSLKLDRGFAEQAINHFYRFLVERLTPNGSSAPWPLPDTGLSRLQTRIPLDQLGQSQHGTRASWYRLPNSDRAALLVVQPLRQDDQLKGFLLYSQTGEALVSMTNNALRRVTNRVLLVMALVVAVLILYASVLSWRIRHLKQQAEAAISSDGKINAFTASSRQDEIGDLSRSYHQLLQRVGNYTQYLETLSGKLAHELRTPLAIVKSSLELALASPGQNGEYLQRAQDGSERLRLILSAMSEASRVEQALQNTEFNAFDLTHLVHSMAQAYADTYPGHRFTSAVPQTPAWISGNPELIVQLLDKLADNARDFAPPDSTIELAIHPHKHKWLLTVSNQGPTLPPNLDGQLFDSLVSQRNADYKGESPHLGLGLYIVRLIALAHQGKVEAHNRAQGDGVVFTVTLPAVSAPA